MRATFVLSGFEGAKYTLQCELSAIPRPGDHIIISRPHQDGTEEFVVRHVSWYLHHPDNPDADEDVGTVRGVTIECDRARAWEPAWMS